jgi:hypothetical protein
MMVEDLRTIAKFQKAILTCVLIYLSLIGFQFVLESDQRQFLLVVFVPLCLTATVFVFLLALKVYDTGTGIALAVLTLIPCIGLVALLIINGKATAVLKQHGIRVGLLGANLIDIR